MKKNYGPYIIDVDPLTGSITARKSMFGTFFSDYIDAAFGLGSPRILSVQYRASRGKVAYRLSIEILGDYDALYSKGHHEFSAFVEACCADQGCKPDEVNKPQHEWWRWRPRTACDDAEYSVYQMDAEPHARGAFPVTVSWK